MKNNPTILITGASGFVGSYLVEYFLDKGLKVRAMTKSGQYFIDHPHLEVVHGDMRNLGSLYEATLGVSSVVHLAAAKQDEKDSFEINVSGAKNLVKAAVQNKVDLIVNISTASTKIAQKGIYGETKNLADQIFEQSQISTITLKPSLIYKDLKNAAFGSLVKFSRLPITPVFGSGECQFRPIYIEDFAKAICIALQDIKLKNKTYDVVGPSIVSMNTLIKLIGYKILNKKVRIIHVPAKLGFLLVRMLSLIFYKSPITRSNILGSTQDIEMDYQSFVKDFGFNPKNLTEGLEILKKELVFDEAKLILSYAVSRSLPKIKITNREKQLYYQTVSKGNISSNFSDLIYKHPFILGPLEFLSNFYKNAVLPQKIYIAMVIIECSPSSAEWLLPKSRSIFNILFQATYLSLSFLLKVFLSLFFIPFPNFVKRNVA
ncbi:MAG: NAD-dependent epimerase/dehydratase family protein [Candidatus Paceibacterota bacterium]|jgi:NADH dehydrogenase